MRVREHARQVGADLVLHGVVGLVLDPLLQPEGRAEVGPEPRLDGRHREPLPVAAAVDVVAGVAAGEQAVAGAGHRAGGQVLVDRQRHQRQHAVGHRHVEVGALACRRPRHEGGEDRHHRVHAAAALSATVAPGMGGRMSGPRPEQSR